MNWIRHYLRYRYFRYCHCFRYRHYLCLFTDENVVLEIPEGYEKEAGFGSIEVPYGETAQTIVSVKLKETQDDNEKPGDNGDNDNSGDHRNFLLLLRADVLRSDHYIHIEYQGTLLQLQEQFPFP